MTAPTLLDGERLIATFTPDRATYWRGHVIMAVVLGAGAGLFLLWQGNPYPVMGPLGAGAAIAIRAAYVASEAMSDLWYLTDRRLIGPRDAVVPRARIKAARPFFGSVQIITDTGDKHLIKYLADPATDAARILENRR
ncbi:MAG: hypothetical protein JXR75_04990 [Rhodobacteraceae bacterium]|nr:hypothetical protein [Paracoccaceae bacterium]